MKKSALPLFILLYSIFGQGQEMKDQDRAAIMAMCGCYEVEFRFAETFSPDAGYVKHPDYRATALEWITPVATEENRIALQHLLLVGDSTVIKHWRQDWEYESRFRFDYQGPSTWSLSEANMPVRGSWTQKVYQVDDSPRYAGTATWIHADGKHYWENLTPSPLPRREYTKRSDYDLMVRGNRHEITPTGWVHEQDNLKVLLTEKSKHQLIAEEKGRNTYRKVADSKCRVARVWWENHEEFWNNVRWAWKGILDQSGTLNILKSVEGKPLHAHLAGLETKGSNPAEIAMLLSRFAQITPVQNPLSGK